LTVTRAVSGLAGSTSQRASARRLGGASFGSGCRFAGTPAVTCSPYLSYAPFTSTKDLRGVFTSSMTMTRGSDALARSRSSTACRSCTSNLL